MRRLQGSVQVAVGAVEVVVRRRVTGIERALHTNRRARRVADVGGEACAGRREERGAEAAAVPDGDALDRPLQDVCLDLAPEIRLRPAPARPERRRLDAGGRLELLEQVLRGVRDTLEHGAREVAEDVLAAQADERSADVAVPERRALAEEVGEEEQAVRTARRGRRSGERLLDRAAGAVGKTRE